MREKEKIALLKQEIFMRGIDEIAKFCGTVNVYSWRDSVIDKYMDEVIAKMDDPALEAAYEMYAVSAEEELYSYT